MKIGTILSMASSLFLLTQTAVADISLSGAPLPGAVRRSIQERCELMASNAVRAKFQGMEDKDGEKNAVFEVLENLGHRRFVRYGDGAMHEGTLFTISMNGATAGQPTEIKDEISRMKPGDQAIMKIDHIFIFSDPQGQNVRPCTRMARIMPEPASSAKEATEPQQSTTPQQPALPTTVAPLNSRPQRMGESYSSSFSMRPDGKGGVIQERIDTVSKYDPATGQVTTRMYINGTEVDPQTRQPLQQPTPQQNSSK